MPYALHLFFCLLPFACSIVPWLDGWMVLIVSALCHIPYTFSFACSIVPWLDGWMALIVSALCHIPYTFSLPVPLFHGWMVGWL
jgi:hypothetical protein